MCRGIITFNNVLYPAVYILTVLFNVPHTFLFTYQYDCAVRKHLNNDRKSEYKQLKILLGSRLQKQSNQLKSFFKLINVWLTLVCGIQAAQPSHHAHHTVQTLSKGEKLQHCGECPQGQHYQTLCTCEGNVQVPFLKS